MNPTARYATTLGAGAAFLVAPLQDMISRYAPTNKPLVAGIEQMVGSGSAFGQVSKTAYSVSPRDEFRKLGWEVYDAKTDSLKKIIPPMVLEYQTNTQRLNQALIDNQHRVKDNLPSDIYNMLIQLTDVSAKADKLLFAYVSPDGRLTFSIKSEDTNLGLNGKYMVSLVNPPKDLVEVFRKISPDFGKYARDKVSSLQ